MRKFGGGGCKKKLNYSSAVHKLILIISTNIIAQGIGSVIGPNFVSKEITGKKLKCLFSVNKEILV